MVVSPIETMSYLLIRVVEIWLILLKTLRDQISLPDVAHQVVKFDHFFDSRYSLNINFNILAPWLVFKYFSRRKASF